MFDVDADETIEDSEVTAYIETAGSDYVTQEATIAFDKLAGLTEKELAEKLSQEVKAQQKTDAEFWTDQYFDAETGNFPTHLEELAETDPDEARQELKSEVETELAESEKLVNTISEKLTTPVRKEEQALTEAPVKKNEPKKGHEQGFDME